MNQSPLPPPASVTKTATVRLQTVDGQGMRFNARMGEYSCTLDTGAEAQGPTPMDVILAALGGCTGMDVIGILRKKRQEITGYEVEVIGERRMNEHPKLYTKVEIVHRVRGRNVNPAAVEEAIRLSDTKYCSVHAMLHHGVPITSRWEILPES
jgi:putative redox protein